MDFCGGTRTVHGFIAVAAHVAGLFEDRSTNKRCVAPTDVGWEAVSH